MKGHIRERSPGHWAIIIDDRDPSTGKRKRRWHSFAGTKRQAQLETARLINAMQNGTLAEPSRLTVAAYLDRWLEHVTPQVAPKTFERYAQIVRVNLKPAIGWIVLTKLQPIQISAAYATALARLSPRSVHHMHRVLSQALKQAVRWRLLPRNPCEDVDPPSLDFSNGGNASGRRI